ncbi:20674_t:CDS:2, partial [Gigaspora rosea]
KKNALEAENANLRQIIEKNSRHIEFKSRIEELDKSRADTASENAELKTEQLPISSSAKNKT